MLNHQDFMVNYNQALKLLKTACIDVGQIRVQYEPTHDNHVISKSHLEATRPPIQEPLEKARTDADNRSFVIFEVSGSDEIFFIDFNLMCCTANKRHKKLYHFKLLLTKMQLGQAPSEPPLGVAENQVAVDFVHKQVLFDNLVYDWDVEVKVEMNQVKILTTGQILGDLLWSWKTSIISL